MSRIAHLFAVPLTVVNTDDTNFNGEPNSKKTNGVEDKDKVSETALEDKKNGETKPNGEVQNGSPKRKRKNKKQIQPAPVRTYIDYDKDLEDNQPSLWTWQSAAHSTGGSREVAPCAPIVAPSAQREVVSYQELAQSQNSPRNWHAQHKNGHHQLNSGPPGLQNRCHLPGQAHQNFLPGQQNTGNSNLLNKGPFLKRKAHQHQHQNKIARMNIAVNKTNGNSINGNNTNGNATSFPRNNINGNNTNGNAPPFPRNNINGNNTNGNAPPFPRNSINGNNINGNVPSFPIALANNFIDPLVAATEKKELFQKPNPQPIVASNGRKPLTSKQRKRLKKAKMYKAIHEEKMRLHLEKEKERIASMKLLPCRYFSNGNCSKGAECPYNHEFVPQKKPELCKFYVISFCEKGTNCLYYHNDWPCKFFHAYRSCSQGERCRFSHQPLTDETRPLLEKALSENNQPGVPAAGMFAIPESQRTVDAKAQGPFSFFGTSNAHQHPGFPFPMSHHPGFHQPWNVKLVPIDVDDGFWSYIPTDASGNDPRIKERLLRKDEPLSYAAPHKRVPLVLLECPRITCFSLDVPDSSSHRAGEDKISVDCERSVVMNGDSICFKSEPAETEESTQESVLPGSLNLLSAKDGVPDEVKTARHLSLPIMQIVARGSANKFTLLKRGSGVSGLDSPNLSSELC